MQVGPAVNQGSAVADGMLGCASPQDRGVRQDYGVGEVIRHRCMSRAISEQPVLPMRSAVVTSGEAMPRQGAQFVPGDHRMGRLGGTPDSPDQSSSVTCSANCSAD